MDLPRQSISVAHTPSRPVVRKPPRLRRLAGIGVRHGVLIVLALLFILPFFWMVSTSLKLPSQIFVWPPVWLPNPFAWFNYPKALGFIPFFRYLLNTLYYGVATVLGVLLSSSLVAYGFARVRWRGRQTVFMIMIATMMIPFQVIMIPLFILFHALGWVGSFKPLIIPTFFGSSVFSTFLLRQFFLTIPQTLSDAARIDGASEFAIYYRIILPLAKPALATVALFQFMYAWNDFLGPLIYINRQSLYTISLGLQSFLSAYGTQWGLLMAASTVATLPMILLFFLTQRTFIQGINLTGIKG